MKKNIQDLLIAIIKNALKDLDLQKKDKEALCLDIPQDIRFGDLSTNIALRLSKATGKSPLGIATALADNIKKYLEKSNLRNYIKEVMAEGEGFINFYLSNNYFYEQLHSIISKGKNFIRVNVGKGRRVLIEFVSANPTGPLSVAHARQAVAADVLANILDCLGFCVRREYYLNDEGNQINILGKSIELRLKELSGERVEFPEDYYQGEYIYDIAKKISASAQGRCASGAKGGSAYGGKNLRHKTWRIRQELWRKKSSPFAKASGDSPSKLEERRRTKINPSTMLRIDGERSRTIKNISEYGVKYILAIIKNELNDFGVRFDYWYSQKRLRKSGKINRVLNFLKRKGFIYEQDGALWFKSSLFGDDKDRVVVKSDGTYTYLAPDIAYHQDKFKRGFSWLINFWGPDHHGYINRLKAAVRALGKNPGCLSIIIVQLASIFREGKPIQMSTRRGQYITLREVLDEVGLDASRFFFLMRRTASHLDFDLDIAKKETPENPVYYVQYAHARICSILLNASIKIRFKDIDLTVLEEREEIGLIKKLCQFSYILNICFTTLDPYMLTVYLQTLAENFHKFYDKHRVLGQDGKLTKARLALVEGARLAISSGLDLLGVSKPEKM